jgi:hypothetical protein
VKIQKWCCLPFDRESTAAATAAMWPWLVYLVSTLCVGLLCSSSGGGGGRGFGLGVDAFRIPGAQVAAHKRSHSTITGLLPRKAQHSKLDNGLFRKSINNNHCVQCYQSRRSCTVCLDLTSTSFAASPLSYITSTLASPLSPRVVSATFTASAVASASESASAMMNRFQEMLQAPLLRKTGLWLCLFLFEASLHSAEAAISKMSPWKVYSLRTTRG